MLAGWMDGKRESSKRRAKKSGDGREGLGQSWCAQQCKVQPLPLPQLGLAWLCQSEGARRLHFYDFRKLMSYLLGYASLGPLFFFSSFFRFFNFFFTFCRCYDDVGLLGLSPSLCVTGEVPLSVQLVWLSPKLFCGTKMFFTTLGEVWLLPFIY